LKVSDALTARIFLDNSKFSRNPVSICLKMQHNVIAFKDGLWYNQEQKGVKNAVDSNKTRDERGASR
jgi:hypothetical protein